jgi:hypothetical protein
VPANATTAADSCAWQPLQVAARLAASQLIETSGVAPSVRRADLFWAINDSGNAAALYALDAHGGDLGSFEVGGAKNRDWEDLDSFVLDGAPYLLIAETGDNEAEHTRSRLYVVPEPQPGTARKVAVAWTVSFVYPDGPRDCEAVAVDPAGERVLLLTKRDTPPRVYSVPLRAPADGELARAELLATLAWPANDATRTHRMPWMLLADRPTAWDISPRWIAILTYGRVYTYERIAGEPLTEALAREPSSLELSGGFKAEALALGGDGSMYVTGEGEHAPILASTCTCADCAP